MKLSARNPLRSTLLSVLAFEIVVFWLALAGMIRISGVPASTALIWVSVASVLAIIATFGLRAGWGYWFAWATQLAAVALGLLTPWMYLMGIIFALIWIMSFVLGRRLESRPHDRPV